MSTLKQVKLDDIHVNLLNPRHVPQESEEYEFEQIIKHGKLEKLMLDIVEYGLDPSENLLLTFDKELNAYIVQEGNRRVTALKLLKNPELFPIIIDNREKHIDKIKKIISENNYRTIDKIPAIIMNDIELMNHFIELKHTKNHDGAGRLDWKNEDQTRFTKNKDPFKNNLLELLMKIVPGKTNNFNFTTVERIIGDPDMRNALTLEINKTLGQIKFKSASGFENFKYIVKGLANKTFTVGNFHSKQDRINFINEHFSTNEQNTEDNHSEEQVEFVFISDLIEEEKPKFKNTLESNNMQNEKNSEQITDIEKDTFNNNLNNSNEEQNHLSDIKTKRNKKQAEPKKRPYFFYGINYAGDSYGIKNSLYEIHNLDAKKFPFATTMLFRTLFECVIQQYITANHLTLNTRQPISSLSIATLLKLCTDNGSGNFKILEKHNKSVARVLSEAHSHKDEDELNMVTHGNYRDPSYLTLVDIERRWYEVIKIMIQSINEKAEKL